MRLFEGIYAQSEAIDGPVYFGIFTSISADLGPAAPFDAIVTRRYALFVPFCGTVSIADVASCGNGPWIRSHFPLRSRRSSA
jgi:hypothetical protein